MEMQDGIFYMERKNRHNKKWQFDNTDVQYMSMQAVRMKISKNKGGLLIMESVKDLLVFIFGVSFLTAGTLAIANPFLTAKKVKKYAGGLQTKLNNLEELLQMIRNMNCSLVKQVYFNEQGIIEIQGKAGKHKLYLENDRIFVLRDESAKAKMNYRIIVEENAILDFVAKEENHDLPINPFSQYKKAMRLKKLYWTAMIGVFSSIFLIVVVTLMPSGNDYIQMVKNGSPKGYPDITYQEAFGEYFSNISWKYFQADDGRNIVEFHGNCLYNDDTVDICFQFAVDKDQGTFSTEYMGIDGEAQNMLTMSAVVDEVFEEYEN